MNIMSENVNELFTALSKAQGELRLVEKSANNPFFKSKYADIAAFIKETREVLHRYDLTVSQPTIWENDKILLVTTLGHKSGQWIRGYLPIICEKKFPKDCSKEKEIAIINSKPYEYNSPQDMGSAITYARRYAFTALINTCGGDDDDDAEQAQSRPELSNEHKSWIGKVVEIYNTDNEYNINILKAMIKYKISSIDDMPMSQLKSIVANYALWKAEQESKKIKAPIAGKLQTVEDFEEELKREF